VETVGGGGFARRNLEGKEKKTVFTLGGKRRGYRGGLIRSSEGGREKHVLFSAEKKQHPRRISQGSLSGQTKAICRGKEDESRLDRIASLPLCLSKKKPAFLRRTGEDFGGKKGGRFARDEKEVFFVGRKSVCRPLRVPREKKKQATSRRPVGEKGRVHVAQDSDDEENDPPRARSQGEKGEAI